MKDPMKSRDKITQKMSRDGLNRAKPDHGRKRAYQQAHTGRGFSENAGAASRTGRGAASRGAFHVLLPLPHAPEHFSKPQDAAAERVMEAYRRGTDPESLEKSCPASAGSGSVKGAAVPSAIYRRGTGNAGAGKVHQEIGQSRRPFGPQRGRHFPQRRNRGCNLTSRKRRRASRASAIPYPPRAGSRISSITRYIPWRKTIPALRGRTNPRKPPSAWENTVSERSKRATVATS